AGLGRAHHEVRLALRGTMAALRPAPSSVLRAELRQVVTRAPIFCDRHAKRLRPAAALRRCVLGHRIFLARHVALGPYDIRLRADAGNLDEKPRRSGRNVECGLVAWRVAELPGVTFDEKRGNTFRRAGWSKERE